MSLSEDPEDLLEIIFNIDSKVKEFLRKIEDNKQNNQFRKETGKVKKASFRGHR